MPNPNEKDPLAPKVDTSWLEMIPVRRNPWDNNPAAAPAPTSPSIEALCTLCGHDERFSSATGICGSRKNQDDISSGRCGCKCIFPEPEDKQ